MKSTHRGSCQACGAIQKLPAGVLAKHGYTRRWNVFDGICKGTGHRPFEQDYSLVARFIASAEKKQADLEGFQTRLRERPTEAKGWLRIYEPRFGRHRWTPREFQLIDVPTAADYLKGPRATTVKVAVSIDPATQKTTRLPIYDVHSEDILDWVASANKTRANDLQRDIDHVKQYIAWQRRRVAEWKEQPLLPIEKEEKQSA